MPEDVVNLNVRMPKSVWANLKGAAVDNDRSLNSEIVHALKEWLAGRGRPREK